MDGIMQFIGELGDSLSFVFGYAFAPVSIVFEQVFAPVIMFIQNMM
ncbi:MAG: hypothetical protein IJN81_02655 [Clostridia bacterium]|nr:hypothetical protein [Clostridia bacterium]